MPESKPTYEELEQEVRKLKEEAEKLTFQDFIPEHELSRAAKIIDKVISDRESQVIELDGLRRDKTVFPIEVALAPLIKNGEVIGVQGVARD
jgi:PAS domain S-box-containing protein